MAFLTLHPTLVGLYYHHRPILSVTPPLNQNNNTAYYYLLFCLYPNYSTKRWLSSSTEPTPADFSGKNAYDILGVTETSSFAEIKASFRKLAKETHPDLAHSKNDSSASQRFVQILAAYEILSDSEKRAHYDRYLLSQRMLVQRHSRQGSIIHTYESHRTTMKQMEVVEWLKWYRYAINDILAEKKVVVGSDYFDVLERDFYSAIHAAYYGPVIESMDLLPDCFEAEERSMYGTPEVLHLVSGRDLFGMVCVADKIPEISESYNEKLTSFTSGGSGLCQSIDNVSAQLRSAADDVGICQMQAKEPDYHSSDAYKDLELHVSGRVVAVATRVWPKSFCNGIQNEDSQDHIHVYLSSHVDPMYASKWFSRDSFVGIADGSRIPLGRITGLGTNPEEGSCYVYNNSGVKTHVIMKHRTLLVCVILHFKVLIFNFHPS
uniref:J domain-containing protein n=1 Tax=Davidia involucrata TaxID=16924 RepID=A0A5B7CGR1_DAVIN